MSTAVKRRRGTSAQHAAFTGQLAELTVDTDKNVVVVHDGVTPGGFPAARADQVLGALVNVKAFGAKGDGVTDDTAAFTAALAASKSVYLPSGTYKVTGNIHITQQGTRLFGDGIASIIKWTGAGADGIIRIDGAASPAILTFAHLQDLQITGSGTCAIRILEAAKVTMKRVFISPTAVGGFTYGIKLDGGLILSFDNVQVQNCVTNVSISTSSGYPGNLIQFNDCQLLGAVTRAILAVQGSCILFKGCQIEANGTAAQPESVCDFSDMGTVGINPAVIFDACWFESNKGGADVKYRGNNASSGIAFICCNFYSTAVNYNIDADNGHLLLSGNGLNAAVITKNLLAGATTEGGGIGNLVGSMTLTAGSGVIVQDSANKYQGKQRFNPSYLQEWYVDNVTKLTLAIDNINAHLLLSGSAGTKLRVTVPAIFQEVFQIFKSGAEHSVGGGDGGAGTYIWKFLKFDTSLAGGVKGNGILNLQNTPNYADNAAAVAGGLQVGDVYRNGDVMQIVH